MDLQIYTVPASRICGVTHLHSIALEWPQSHPPHRVTTEKGRIQNLMDTGHHCFFALQHFCKQKPAESFQEQPKIPPVPAESQIPAFREVLRTASSHSKSSEARHMWANLKFIHWCLAENGEWNDC